MKKYLLLQLKRAYKIFPYVLAVTLVLLLGVSIALSAMLTSSENKTENTRVRIGVSGDLENSFLRLGIGAFQAFDDTKYSLEIIEYSEAEAAKALKKGAISAYIVMPDDFVEKAWRGEIEPVRFVTTVNAGDMVTMFKNEILSVITDMAVASQQGTYGLGDALRAEGYEEIVGEVQSEASMGYFDQVVGRSRFTEVVEIGVGARLPLAKYYICSILIFFLLLMGLPYAALYCKSDNSLTALLSSKGTSCTKILLGEYLSHLISLTTLFIIVLGGTAIADKVFDLEIFGDTTGCPFVYTLPTLIMLSCFNIMVFELSSSVISGVLIHFFLSISLCYISGCFFPIQSFPRAVQEISAFLPISLAREQMSGFFTGEVSLPALLFVLGYAAFFFAVTLLVKRYKLIRRSGGAL